MAGEEEPEAPAAGAGVGERRSRRRRTKKFDDDESPPEDASSKEPGQAATGAAGKGVKDGPKPPAVIWVKWEGEEAGWWQATVSKKRKTSNAKPRLDGGELYMLKYEANDKEEVVWRDGKMYEKEGKDLVEYRTEPVKNTENTDDSPTALTPHQDKRKRIGELPETIWICWPDVGYYEAGTHTLEEEEGDIIPDDALFIQLKYFDDGSTEEVLWDGKELTTMDGDLIEFQEDDPDPSLQREDTPRKSRRQRSPQTEPNDDAAPEPSDAEDVKKPIKEKKPTSRKAFSGGKSKDIPPASAEEASKTRGKARIALSKVFPTGDPEVVRLRSSSLEKLVFTNARQVAGSHYKGRVQKLYGTLKKPEYNDLVTAIIKGTVPLEPIAACDDTALEALGSAERKRVEAEGEMRAAARKGFIEIFDACLKRDNATDLAEKLEEVTFETQRREIGPMYKERILTLNSNLKQNTELVAAILEGDIEVAAVAKMESAELANRRAKEQREAYEKQQMNEVVIVDPSTVGIVKATDGQGPDQESNEAAETTGSENKVLLPGVQSENKEIDEHIGEKSSSAETERREGILEVEPSMQNIEPVQNTEVLDLTKDGPSEALAEYAEQSQRNEGLGQFAEDMMLPGEALQQSPDRAKRSSKTQGPKEDAPAPKRRRGLKGSTAAQEKAKRQNSVWRGSINNPETRIFRCAGYLLDGPVENVDVLDGNITILGRSNIKSINKFLTALQNSTSRTMTVLYLNPESSTEEDAYWELAQFLRGKGRAGVLMQNEGIHEAYLLPPGDVATGLHPKGENRLLCVVVVREKQPKGGADKSGSPRKEGSDEPANTPSNSTSAAAPAPSDPEQCSKGTQPPELAPPEPAPPDEEPPPVPSAGPPSSQAEPGTFSYTESLLRNAGR